MSPGNYIAFFRFVHGDNLRFGQKVWCDILVQGVPPTEAPKQAEPKEERSSLLNDSMMQSQIIPNENKTDFKFELVDQPVVQQQPIDLALDQRVDLSQSHFEEKSSLEDDVEEVKKPEEPVLEEKLQEPLK